MTRNTSNKFKFWSAPWAPGMAPVSIAIIVVVPGVAIGWATGTLALVSGVAFGVLLLIATVCSIWRLRSDLAMSKRTILMLKKKDAELRDVVDHSLFGWWEIDVDFKTTFANQRMAEMLGTTLNELMGRSPLEFVHEDDRDALMVRLHNRKSGMKESYEIRYRRKDNGSPWSASMTATPRLDSDGYLVSAAAIVLDVTRRVQTDHERALTIDILRILNEPRSLVDLTKNIITSIKCSQACDAVGLRLKKGDDFPYCCQVGFSDAFVAAESSLLSRAKDGGICRTDKGAISMDCTCGLVCLGKTDQKNALFTPGGSAWVNDSSFLLKLPAAQDPRLSPRNRCVHEGYSSVALIPIRCDQEIVGLLQLNAYKTNHFTLETVRFYEHLCAIIGVGLMSTLTREALQTAQAELTSYANAVVDAQEEERKRIAQELHEGVIQTLSLARHRFQSTAMSGTGPDGDELLGLGIDEIRRITHSLHPSILVDLGLAAAMQSLCSDFEARTQKRTTVIIEGISVSLGSQVDLTLFRIMQEALNNIEKHSDATMVSLDFSVKDWAAHLRIFDNGKGFSIKKDDKAPTGLGLRHIKERAHAAGGFALFDFSPGKGTNILIRIPITKAYNAGGIL